MVVGFEGVVHDAGEEASFQAGGSQHGLLGQCHSFEGEELLGVDGVVDVDEVGFEIGDFGEVFQADDSEGGGGEAVPGGVLGGAGFSFGSCRSGGFGGVCPVGC